MTIERIRLVKKSGGKSGLYSANDQSLGEGHG